MIWLSACTYASSFIDETQLARILLHFLGIFILGIFVLEVSLAKLFLDYIISLYSHVFLPFGLRSDHAHLEPETGYNWYYGLFSQVLLKFYSMGCEYYLKDKMEVTFELKLTLSQNSWLHIAVNTCSRSRCAFLFHVTSKEVRSFCQPSLARTNNFNLRLLKLRKWPILNLFFRFSTLLSYFQLLQ